MAQAAQSRGFFGFLPKQQKRNIFGWSKKEKTARRKHVGASATEARGAGYRYATHKSDENFSEWMDRKDFGGKIKSNEKERLASAFSMGFDRGKKELEFKASKAVRKEEKRKKKKEDATAKRQKRSTDAKKSGIGKKSFWTAAGLAADEKWNPARSAAQYRLAQAVLSGTARSSMPRKVAQEIVDRTPAKMRSQYMKNPTSRNIRRNPPNRRFVVVWETGETIRYFVEDRNTGIFIAGPFRTKSSAQQKADSLERASRRNPKRNPAADAAALSTKFHGRQSTSQKRIVEQMHEHKHLMEIGPLVRLVVDTPTNKVAVLNFNTSDPKKIVYLSSSEKDPKTGKIVGKQLYLRGGDQEVNLKGLGMDSALWIRDKMELGRLHEFKRGDPKLIVDGEEVKGSITYRTRKGMDDFKLIDYWHRSGEETSRKAGPAARPLVIYDYRNKKLELAGGQYVVDRPGIIN